MKPKLRQLQRRLDERPDDIDALEQYVEITCIEKPTPDAIARVARAVERVPDDPRARTLEARMFLEQDLLEDAQRSIDLAAGLGAEAVVVTRLRFALAFARDDLETAGSVAKAHLEVEPGSLAVRLLVASALTLTSRHAELVELLEPVVTGEGLTDATPELLLDANLLLARAYRELGRTDRGRMMFERVLRDDPANSDAIIGISTCLLDAGRDDEALSALEDFTQDFPKDVDVLTALFDAYEITGHDRDALAIGQRLIRLDDHVQTREAMAHIHFNCGEFDAARSHLQRAIGLDSTLPDVRVDLAEVLAHLNRPVECDQQLAIAEQLAARPFDVAIVRADAFALRGRPDESLAHATEATRLEPESSRAHHARAVALLSLDRLDDADSALQAALDLTPDSTPILVTGVDIRLRQKRFDDALELIRKVEAIDPETGAELRERLKG
jgi:tetratricopeptide (TPR) repeat protein